MLRLFGVLKSYLQPPVIETASSTFRIHCAFTTALLMAGSLIITANQFVGKPIQCIVDGPGNLQQPITTFCWISSTFTMPDAHSRKVGLEVPHPGVGNDYDEPRKYHSYYQWVCIVLFLQGLLCYFPMWLWNMFEGGLLQSLTMGLKFYSFDEAEKKKKKKVIMKYLREHVKAHNFYAFMYWFCEVLCLINIVSQLFIMDYFFDGEFLTYGLRVLSFAGQNQEERVDPMVYVFPKVTKCVFHKFGPSGSVQKHDSMCVLPLNVVNEKTYICIWFWFMTLLTMLMSLVLYRLVTICCPLVRSKLLQSRNRTLSKTVADALVRKTSIGDWWLLYMIARNMDPIMYREVATDLAKKVDTDYSYMEGDSSQSLTEEV